MIDFEKFCDLVMAPLFRGSLSVRQKTALRLIVNEAAALGVSLPVLAYVLATGYHESQRFLIMTETGKGSGRPYGSALLIISRQYETYYGRGWVQLTWIRNYALLSVYLSLRLGRPIDLVGNPELATDPEIANQIMWQGMLHGLFTGARLDQFINAKKTDFVGARAIVNGTDRASLIAGYAADFLSFLERAKK